MCHSALRKYTDRVLFLANQRGRTPTSTPGCLGRVSQLVAAGPGGPRKDMKIVGTVALCIELVC